MSVGAALILAWLTFVVGLFVGLALAKRAPACGCGDVERGGDCIGREDDMPPERSVDPWLQTR